MELEEEMSRDKKALLEEFERRRKARQLNVSTDDDEVCYHYNKTSTYYLKRYKMKTFKCKAIICVLIIYIFGIAQIVQTKPEFNLELTQFRQFTTPITSLWIKIEAFTLSTASN